MIFNRFARSANSVILWWNGEWVEEKGYIVNVINSLHNYYNQMISNQYTIVRDILKIWNWLFDDDKLEKFENFVFGQKRTSV
jgi:hypothetical protein